MSGEKRAQVPGDDPAAELMLAFKRGDDSAFERLVSLTKRSVFMLAFRHGFDEATADDIAQETFLRLWRARDAYEPRARFRAYLLRIAANLILSERRSRRRMRRVALPDEAAGEAPLADPRSAEPDASFSREEVDRAVEQAIAELPETQRLALGMSRFEGASYREIAEALDSSPEAVKSALFRARQSLKEKLAPYTDAISTETSHELERLKE